MRRLAILVLIILLSLSPASLAEDSSLPICTDEEFLVFFNMIVEHQIMFDGDIRNASMLNFVSRAQMQRREGYQPELPMCSDAVAIQRLLIQLGGDALGRAALELADLPDGENPYLLRLPDDQARIESLLTAMLGIDRSDARQSERRELPACESEDWTRLNEAADALLDLSNSTSDEADPAKALAAIDRLLLWREENIPALPECAESIDLIQAMSAAATDSAAYQAFTYGGVSLERNPFPPLLEAGIATVTSWKEQLPVATVSQAAASTAQVLTEKQLPVCADAELSEALAGIRSEYAAVMERADSAESTADMADFAEAEIALRESVLAQLPLCAEAFEARWRAAEVLADAALQSAIKGGALESIAQAHRVTMVDNDMRASSGWEKLESALGRVDTAPSASDDSRSIALGGASAPECDDADHVFLFAYLVPEFWSLTDAALAISQPEEVPAFIDKSYAFRRLLWANLPRCDDALEMGALMRSVAADTVSMLALELAGTPVWNIPYLRKIAGDIERFFEWTGEFSAACGNIGDATTTYYVVAENIANIRSCASTNCEIITTASRGQRLDVADDLSNWYEIVLPSCETAFVAGFLVSQTPPPR